MANHKHFKLTLFGGFRLVDTDNNALVTAVRKSKALFAWLAINPDIEHPREKLAALLWPDSEEAAARHSLRQALADLRKIIPVESEVLNTSKDFISLNSTHIEIDVQNFLKALSRGDSESLDYAIELYSGEFLEGCNPHSDMFEEWGMVYRNDFNERATVAIDLSLSQHLKKKNYGKVVNLAMRLIAIDPLRESAYRALMLAHNRLGNHATALRWYRRCQHILQQELDVSPSPETETLYNEELHKNSTKDKNHDDTSRSSFNVDHEENQQPWLNNANSFIDTLEEISTDNKRAVYQIKMAIGGILDQIGGQSLLIRGEAGVGKSELTTKIIDLAKSQGFFCCRKKLSAKTNGSDATILKELTYSFSSCLLNFPNSSGVKDRSGSTCDIEKHKKITSVDGDIAKLVKTTSSLQPVLLVVEHIHEANMDTLNLLAELITSAGNCSMLLLMTSRFDGEPLDPVWRGAMRGAPLTTIDMS